MTRLTRGPRTVTRVKWILPHLLDDALALLRRVLPSRLVAGSTRYISVALAVCIYRFTGLNWLELLVE